MVVSETTLLINVLSRHGNAMIPGVAKRDGRRHFISISLFVSKNGTY